MRNRTFFIRLLAVLLILLSGLNVFFTYRSEQQKKEYREKIQELEDKNTQLTKRINSLELNFESAQQKNAEMYESYISYFQAGTASEAKNESLSEETVFLCSSLTWAIGEEVPLPSLSTVRKVCMDYRSCNIAGSPHYRIQQYAWTDEIGCRRFDEDYIVALGTFYTDKIGERFEITLENGYTFTVIVGDIKADKDTDENNMFAYCPQYGTSELGANVLEFIVELDSLSTACYRYGGVDYYDCFRSDISKMVYLGRDTTDDWDLWE